MQVEQIRQDSHVLEYLQLHVSDVEQLHMHKEEFIEVSCPACEQQDYIWKFEKSGFNFVECSICDTLFINPRPTASLLTKFYTSAKSFELYNSKVFPATEAARRSSIFAPRAAKVVELCDRYCVPDDVLIDVGAGFGTFCEEIQKLGRFKEVIAIEPSPGLAETCRQKGLKVVERPIEEVELQEASAVVCFELIEHLYWPKDFLLACAHVISDDGLLILTTPNIKGLDLLVLGPLSENIDGPEHLNVVSAHAAPESS
jgi:SAM-dependent methyltransferase